MYLVVNKKTKKITVFGNSKIRWKDLYFFADDDGIGFYSLAVDLYENITVPNHVERNKWCYTPEDGFYIDPSWK